MSSTQKSLALFQKNCTLITLNIKPLMLPFFTHFVVNTENHTLMPYMAPVNHNVLNETTWANIVHSFMGNFCHETDEQNDTVPMENMGNDACVIIGYHQNVSIFSQFYAEQLTRLLKIILTIDFISLLVISGFK